MLRPRLVAAHFFLLAFVLTATPARAGDVSRYTDGKHGKGELRHVNGIPVMVLEGTPEEMGEQTAVLAADPLKRLFAFPREMVKRQGLEATWPFIVALAKSMEPNFPDDHRRELDALVKKTGVDRGLALFGNTYPDISKAANCSSLIVEKDRSATGRLMFGRNLDYPTLGFLHEYSLVTVYRPQGKHAFAAIGFPGMVGCLSAINDAGLCLTVHEVHSSKDGSPGLDSKGTPYTMCFRQLMEECRTVAEAEKMLRGMKRTTMLNLAVCDKNGGAIFEITTKNVVVRPAEDGLCYCTNHFCSKELGTGVRCRRLPRLDECRRMKKLGLDDVARKLDAVNQGEATLQTMVFEPEALKLHLAIGKGPTSALPLKELDLKPLLTRQ
jgi:hypothetical protein